MKLTFRQLGPFVSDWRRHGLTDEDLRGLENAIMRRPDAGDVMAGTGGLRKLRFAPPSRHAGKSGGFRVCYAHFPMFATVYLVAIFGKNEKSNLSAAERNTARKLMQDLDRELKQHR